MNSLLSFIYVAAVMLISIMAESEAFPIRKRISDYPIFSENDDAISAMEEHEFGLFLEEEQLFSLSFSYSYSYSFSYQYNDDLNALDDDDESPSVSATPSATPSRVVATSSPTKFSDNSSNDNTSAPSSSPSISKSLISIPSSNPTSQTTGAMDPNLAVGTGSSASGNPRESKSTNYTETVLIPVVALLGGAFIAGLAVRAIDRRKGPLEYQNLELESNSSFSYDA
jgi:hypothetical protein